MENGDRASPRDISAHPGPPRPRGVKREQVASRPKSRKTVDIVGRASIRRYSSERLNMEWIADPTAWIGLGALVVLEIVLGIDNLIFVAILADRLPPAQRDRARVTGLVLALVMRLALLAGMSWIVTLTRPLFAVGPFEISGRGIILILGGLFLIFKATMELHERLEGAGAASATPAYGRFWQIVVQIIVLDAVFSLDSVITAVGMVDHLAVMMIAVIIAVGLMIVASKPLTRFVNAHETVVVLCLGFLLMIGFSVLADGLGFHIPKGYLYAAIAFAVAVEAYNQLVRRTHSNRFTGMDLRDRTALAVLRLLGGAPGGGGEIAAIAPTGAPGVFGSDERAMIQGVMTLGERTVRSIMTPRPDVVWLDVDAPEEETRRVILTSGRSRFPIGRRGLDELLGVALAKDVMRDLIEKGRIDLERSARPPVLAPETLNVLRLMEPLRRAPVQLVVVVDEFGSLEGVVTPTDIFEAIAGEFHDEGDEDTLFRALPDGGWQVDGQIDIRRLGQALDLDLTGDDGDYTTLAGFLLWRLGRLPEAGDRIAAAGFVFTILSMKARRVETVEIRPAA